MAARLLPVLLLLALVRSQYVGLNYFQNLTLGNSTPLNAVSYDGSGKNLAAAQSNKLSLFTRDSVTNNWVSSSNYTHTNTITDAAFRGDATWIALIDDTTNNVALLSRNSSSATFSYNSSLSCSSQPVCLSWAYGGNRLLVGLTSGSVEVYALNTTTMQWYKIQTLPAHGSNVLAISGRTSRFVSCGLDGIVKVWYFNYTTLLYNLTANESITTGTRCTAIHMASTQQRFAVGFTNGTVLVYDRDPYFAYSQSVNISAHSAAVNFVRFTSDGVYLLTAGASPDNTTKLWSKASSFGTPLSYPAIQGQSVDWDNNHKEFIIGTFGSSNGNATAQNLNANASCPNGVNSTYTYACLCTYPQAWYNGACAQPTCPSNVNGTLSTFATNASQCNCVTGWVWNDNLQTCIVDCTSATFNTNATGTNFEYYSCYCKSLSLWNYTTMGCVAYIDCSAAPNSNKTNLNNSACNCNPGFLWNGTYCVRNCAAVNLAPTLSKTDPTVCDCISGYVYNSTNFTSIIQGVCQRNCTQFARIKGYDLTDYTACLCVTGYKWDSTIPGCSLVCSTMKYSTGTNKNISTCNCKSGYKWDVPLGQCISSTRNAAVAIACGIAIPLGILALIGLGALVYLCLTPPPPLPYPGAYPYPVSAVPGSNIYPGIPQVNSAQMYGSGSHLVPQAQAIPQMRVPPQPATRGVIGAPMNYVMPQPPVTISPYGINTAVPRF